MLIAYQTSSSGHESISPLLRSPLLSPAQSTEAVHKSNADPQWHMLVDASVMDSLEKSEVKRQGLWWELMNGEVEYVRDLRTICNVGLTPSRFSIPRILDPIVLLCPPQLAQRPSRRFQMLTSTEVVHLPAQKQKTPTDTS